MESNAKMTVETRDPRFKDVVGNAVDITLVGSGYITGQPACGRWPPASELHDESDVNMRPTTIFT